MESIAGILLMFAMLNPPEIPPFEVPSHKELKCLALNVYHEARGESYEGKLAVASVTLERLAHPKYPKTICKVVYQPYQFSWTTNTETKKISAKEWHESLQAAVHAYNVPFIRATHFHNLTIKPKWGLRKVMQIGNHIFYI